MDDAQHLAPRRSEGLSAYVSDLNLPRLDGREVLRKVKASEQLRRIPVIVGRSSRARKDISDCCDLGASCYPIKPLDLRADQDEGVIRTAERFWLCTACLPNNNSAPHHP
jgi:CheY-like chemotaxis protein